MEMWKYVQVLPSSEEDVLESLFEILESDRVLDVFDALEPFLVTFEWWTNFGETGVWARELLRVNGLCNILCFHSLSLFIDSSLGGCLLLPGSKGSTTGFGVLKIIIHIHKLFLEKA